MQEDYPGQPITLLFGCTGGKGLDRREGMGRAAGAYADNIILTEDDPGPEALEDIWRLHRPLRQDLHRHPRPGTGHQNRY